MFFKQIRKNAAKNRKGNGLFFGSLVIAIVAFYTLLSLGEQDVMQYLATVESDAVSKLMMLLPVVYGVSLFFVFFLVYFACKYQMDNRRRELGLYLMLGMKRSRLFLMLFGETLWSSMVSLLSGLPIALFLTEAVSLITAKVAGLDIIGHHFSLSLYGIIWTVCGFVFVQLLSMLFISAWLSRTELADLLYPEETKKQMHISAAKSTVFFVLGLGLLLTAYYLGVFQMRLLRLEVLLAILFCGISGTFLLYRGLGGFLGHLIRRKNPDAVGLWTFTVRQVQENVLSQHKSLAVASLLLLMALACISYGISMGMGRQTGRRSVDFSLFGTEEQLDAALDKKDIQKEIKTSYPLYLSMVKEPYYLDEKKEFDTTEMKNALGGMEDFDGLVENIIENLHIEYVIAESSYNSLLKSMDKKEIHLSEGEVALYTSMTGEGDGEFEAIIEKVLKKGCSVGIDGKKYEILPALCYDNVVADRAITLYMALIVPDTLYTELAATPKAYCRNIRLSDEAVRSKGLMQTVQKMDAELKKTGLEYDSFLGGIGRNLFYTVASSYLTIYLGLLFWLIANTVIGMKYLISQRQTKHRYETLAMLGADMPSMSRSQKKQINIYFSLVLIVSVVSSAAAIVTMFTSFTRLPAGVSIQTIAVFSAAALAAFTVIEMIYIAIVKRRASHEIYRLETTRR